MSKVAMAISEEELLNRLDQMAMEIERLRQQVLESMTAERSRKKFKSVREYEACGMWADRPEWEGLPTEEVLERIREQAWGSAYRMAIPDALIAATALGEKAVLVTSNVRHFSMIDGLRLEKPY